MSLIHVKIQGIFPSPASPKDQYHAILACFPYLCAALSLIVNLRTGNYQEYEDAILLTSQGPQPLDKLEIIQVTKLS